MQAQRELAQLQLRAHARHQLARLERLGHVVDRAGFETLEAIGEVGERRQHHHRRQSIAGQLAEAARQLEAVHARHVDVGDEEIGHVLLRHAQRRQAVAGEHHAIFGCEQRADGVGEARIVLRDEDGRARRARRFEHARQRRDRAPRFEVVRYQPQRRRRAGVTVAGNGGARHGAGGQEHAEHAAAAAQALDGDVAAVRLGELLDDRQTDARAARAGEHRRPPLLEAAEQPLLQIVVDADAGVAHRDAHTIGVLGEIDLDASHPTA